MIDFPESGRKSFEDMAALAASLEFEQGKAPLPVVWIQEEEDKWTPVFTIPSLGEKLGAPRPEKKFYRGEKKLMIFAFANDVAERLFGSRMFNEEVKDGRFVFTPNPDFDP